MDRIKPDTEVLELAISREIEARNFYLALAERLDNPALSKMLENLADEETEHRTKLEMELIKNGIVVDTADRGKSFKLSNYVLTNDAQINLNLKDILDMCIQKEDASFRFYIDMLPQAQDKSSKETLLAIIEDEIKHKSRFQSEYDKLFKKR